MIILENDSKPKTFKFKTYAIHSFPQLCHQVILMREYLICGQNMDTEVFGVLF